MLFFMFNCFFFKCSSNFLLSRLTFAFNFCVLLSASLYFSKRGAYWDRLCRDVVGRWSLVGWSLVGCHVRALWPNGASYAYSYYGTLIGNPTPGIQWYNFRPHGVTPNRGLGPPWGAFCQITLTSCYYLLLTTVTLTNLFLHALVAAFNKLYCIVLYCITDPGGRGFFLNWH